MIIDECGRRLCNPECELFDKVGAGYCDADMLYHGYDKPEYIIDAKKVNYCKVQKGFKMIKDNEVIND